MLALDLGMKFDPNKPRLTADVPAWAEDSQFAPARQVNRSLPVCGHGQHQGPEQMGVCVRGDLPCARNGCGYRIAIGEH